MPRRWGTAAAVRRRRDRVGHCGLPFRCAAPPRAWRRVLRRTRVATPFMGVNVRLIRSRCAAPAASRSAAPCCDGGRCRVRRRVRRRRFGPHRTRRTPPSLHAARRQHVRRDLVPRLRPGRRRQPRGVRHRLRPGGRTAPTAQRRRRLVRGRCLAIDVAAGPAPRGSRARPGGRPRRVRRRPTRPGWAPGSTLPFAPAIRTGRWTVLPWARGPAVGRLA